MQNSPHASSIPNDVLRKQTSLPTVAIRRFSLMSIALAIGLFGQITRSTADTNLTATIPFAPPAPTLVDQPSDQLIDIGAAATNQVTATGTSLAYQWQFNGTALIDATNRTFVISNFQPHHAGGYSVTVANAAGAVTSRVARMELNIARPHSFGTISVETDGSVALAFDGNPSVLFHRYFDLYPLEVSGDLGEWLPVATLVRTNASSSPLTYRDMDAKNSRHRFYRTFTNHFVTPLPKPTGPYSAGSIARLLTDPSRSNRYNIATNSSFMITIWYPARHRAGHLPAQHFEPQLARDTSAWNSLGSPNAVVVAPFFSRHSYEGADLAASQGPFPVVTMSPGFGEFRGNHTAKMEALASHGFIAVSIDHSDCNATVFPGGRLLRSNSSPGQPLLPYFTQSVTDVQFVLNELARMNQDDPIFKGTMDLNRVATMGMSFGGGVAGEVGRIDLRVKAVVFFDAYFQAANSLVQFGLQKPLLYGYSTQAGGDLRLFNKATLDAVAFQITNTRHGDFSDTGVWIDRADNAGRRAGAAVIDCTLSFLKKHLQGEDDHLLDDPAAKYPEILKFQKK